MSDQNPLIGLQIDNYQIRSLLGKGGMASVYLATDVSLKRDVVIKVLLPDLAENEELRLRFQREAQATARLYHPNIVQVYATGSMPDGSPYIALQHIEGGALSDHLQQLSRQGQWISILYALSITRQMAGALQVAHQANIVHRDLKPSNILLRMDGTPVLSDLGIAAVQQATMRLTQTGGIIGTPNYMSPEQASSQVIDGRSDIYSLGVILYELLSGRLPFDADSPWAMLHQHIYEQPAPLAQVRPDLTPQTHHVVDTCLQKSPADRFPNAQALATALDSAIVAENANPLITISATQATVVERAATPIPKPPTSVSAEAKRKWWPYALALVLFLTLCAGALFIWQSRTNLDSADETGPTPLPIVLFITATSAPLHPSPTFAPTATVEVVTLEDPTATATPDQAGQGDNRDSQSGDTLVVATEGMVAYSCGSGKQNQIFLFDLDHGEQLPLGNQPENSVVPAFSRDGTKISYRSDTSGTWQIYTSDVDGSNLRQITSGNDNNYEASWSPDGSQFAFISDRTGSKQVYVMNIDGTNQQQLTFNDNYNDDPSWSVTDLIAYESDQDGRFSIYQIPPSGGIPLLQIDAGTSSTTPAWSPDGTQLAFESRLGDMRHIWTANHDGTNLLRITAEGSNNERPAWSPDGRRLAFHSNYQQSNDSQFDIWLIDVDTRVLRRLTTRGDCFNPAWGRSPGAQQSVVPLVREGIEACRIKTGTTVTAGPNARIWNAPEVLTGQALESVDPGTSLVVKSGPTWGRIRRDIDVSEWWWQVERPSDGMTGWIWQARLRECEAP